MHGNFQELKQNIEECYDKGIYVDKSMPFVHLSSFVLAGFEVGVVRGMKCSLFITPARFYGHFRRIVRRRRVMSLLLRDEQGYARQAEEECCDCS